LFTFSNARNAGIDAGLKFIGTHGSSVFGLELTFAISILNFNAIRERLPPGQCSGERIRYFSNGVPYLPIFNL
jgi:hypothetical protein